jgi:hypothetical protein
MTKQSVPESGLVGIIERMAMIVPRDPKDISRFTACRWLNRVFYDVRGWNLIFIKFLKTYPGFQKSRDQQDYQTFFKGLMQYRASLNDRYGNAKGKLCVYLRMLTARYPLDFRWLYDSDQAKYDELYEIVNSAFSSEDSIIETAEAVVFDVIAKDRLRYVSDLETRTSETTFLDWHINNHQAVVQTILNYEKHSAEAVNRLNDLAEQAGFRLLTIGEYEAALSDPLDHPETLPLDKVPPPVIDRPYFLYEKKVDPSLKIGWYNALLGFIFGVVFITAILLLVVFIPNPTPVQYHFFVIVMSLAAGGAATVITGMIDVQVSFGKRLAIGAAGALAVFVIVFFFLPAMVGH